MNQKYKDEEISGNIWAIAPAVLEEADETVNGDPSYVCECGHGLGYNSGGDGIAIVDGHNEAVLHCFACGFTGSLADYFAERQAVRDSGTSWPQGKEAHMALRKHPAMKAYKAAAIDSLYSKLASLPEYRPSPDIESMRNATTAKAITIDLDITKDGTQRRPKKSIGGKKASSTATNSQPNVNYESYYTECAAHISEASDYLVSRGISLDTALAYRLGFDPEADPAFLPGVWGPDPGKRKPTPRLILPASGQYYVARATTPDIEKRYKALGPKDVSPDIFNINTMLTSKDPVFVTEGIITALSYIEIGAQAVATNSASNTAKLAAWLEKYKPQCGIILAFDNDAAGRGATNTITATCKQCGIDYTIAPAQVIGSGDTVPGGHEDANDLLQKDRDAFAANVSKLLSARPDNALDYINYQFAADVTAFGVGVKTGWAELDRLTGGLHAGLYIVAAGTSLGKTTFCVQLADHLAAAGQHVLYFSLEQSRLEVVSSCLSRRTYKINTEKACTSLQIRENRIKDRSVYKQAIDDMRATCGPTLSIIEGNFSSTIGTIKSYITRYSRQNECKPIVFIDYLQIIQPDETPFGRRLTDMEVVDDCVTELKRLSRDLNVTVIALCSINRANYLTPIDFESLKQSGKIEFSADVVLGFQLAVLDEDPIFEKEGHLKEKRDIVNAAKEADVRKLTLKGLKNRFGKSTFTDSFDYRPAYNTFVEVKRSPRKKV